VEVKKIAEIANGKGNNLRKVSGQALRRRRERATVRGGAQRNSGTVCCLGQSRYILEIGD
jgi:hypothetical protein